MADDKISKTGVWFDTVARKVVEKQPENSVQLVAPGHVIDANAELVIENWRQVDAGQPEVAVDTSHYEDAAEPSKTVTSGSVKK